MLTDMLATSRKQTSPWVRNDFILISLYQMLKFSASHFCSIMLWLDGESKNVKLIALRDRRITEHEAGGYMNMLRMVEEHCAALELDAALDRLEQIEHVLYSGCTNERYQRELSALVETIEGQLRRRLFMYIPISKARYYGQKEPFGEEVATNFKSILYDAEEAVTCYAAGRNTATVMHCMRTLEAGLGAMAKRFQVEFSHESWHQVISNLEKEINKIDPHSSGEEWREQKHFYSESARHFRFLKDAWRNYAMHIHEKYDEERAFSVLEHTKEFLSQLAGGGLTDK